MYDTIEISQDARGVATLTLDRPEKRNAMSEQMIAELAEATKRLGTDASIRVVVLAAAGDIFCAGGDLGWMQTQFDAGTVERRVQAQKLAAMLNGLNSLTKPLLGRVQGNAFGGGIGLMSVCDMVVSVPAAKFGLTETRLGLIPATIGPYVLARMGEANARRVFMSSRVFDAQEAQKLGLVSDIAEDGDLDSVLEREIGCYLSCAPGAVAEAKALARSFGPAIDANAIDRSIEALLTRWASEESSEGIAAFFEKRKPNWSK